MAHFNGSRTKTPDLLPAVGVCGLPSLPSLDFGNSGRFSFGFSLSRCFCAADRYRPHFEDDLPLRRMHLRSFRSRRRFRLRRKRLRRAFFLMRSRFLFLLRRADVRRISYLRSTGERGVVSGSVTLNDE